MQVVRKCRRRGKRDECCEEMGRRRERDEEGGEQRWMRWDGGRRSSWLDAVRRAVSAKVEAI